MRSGERQNWQLCSNTGEENGEEYFYEIEDDDEYETIADAFVDRLENFFEIEEK